jgi:hypothetical protein
MAEDFRSESFQAAQIAGAVKVRYAKKLYRVL